MTHQSHLMDQGEFTSRFCARPQNFAWFLGAGASASAGLPTAADILWDLKCRYYSSQENQDISRQDLQNEAIRAKIQSFMESRGFPALWADDEYPAHFEKIFGPDKERQRQYLKGLLSEERATLSVGNRVLGALIAGGFSRVAFTTNFDTVIEKAVAEVAGQSLSCPSPKLRNSEMSSMSHVTCPLCMLFISNALLILARHNGRPKY
jgi:hypothetical protein